MKDEFDRLYHGEFLLDEPGEIRYTDREKILNEIDRVYGTDTMYMVDSILRQRESDIIMEHHERIGYSTKASRYVNKFPDYSPKKQAPPKQEPVGPSREEIKKILDDIKKQESSFKLD